MGFLLLSIASILLGDLLVAIIGDGSETLSVVAAVIVWVLSIVWGVVVVRMALRKTYSDFRLAN